MKILFVEDDEDVLQTIEIIMSNYDFDVTYVNSGEKCLDLLRQGFRGLIFMDVMMPKLDGWDTLQRAVDENLLDGSIVCMLTAIVNPGPKSETVTMYVQEYLNKPFQAEDLIKVIEQTKTLLGDND